MSAKKIIFFILIPAFFIITIGVLFILNRDKPASEVKIKIKTETKEIPVNNFRKNAEVIENGAEYFVDKEEYNASYYPPNNEFVVTLLANQDIENIRKEAESDFINALGISKEDACKLKVFLYVSAALTTDKSLYQNHGFSFCPGSKTFN